MTYSSGSPGYQPAQSTASFGSSGSSGPSFAKSDDRDTTVRRSSTIAVVALGLAAYFLSFGPVINVTNDLGSSGGSAMRHGPGVAMAALLAALLAAAGLLPKARNYTAIVAVISVLGALLLVERAVTLPDNVSAGWALWVILGLVVLQAIAAVAALLLDAGVVTAPAPRPKYDQYSQYGQYGQYGGYYGQHGQQPYQQHGPQQSSQQGYSSQGSQYGGYSSGPSTGGFSTSGSQQHGSHQSQPQGTSTPPTGFPSFSQPPSFPSGQETQQVSGQQNSGNHGGGVGQGQQSHGGQQPQSPSGPTQS